ncbi:MAG: CxxxxCH/CxxCH domain-containing protein [Bacteroidales bacterium]|nr:CxxxxCH/CxxCH domain-containing protein [Bacteroidales bacterium]
MEVISNGCSNVYCHKDKISFAFPSLFLTTYTP